MLTYKFNLIILIFYLVQRVSELYISKKNELALAKKQSFVEKYKANSLVMKLFHLSWFLVLFTSVLKSNKMELNHPFIYIPLLFFLQIIRFISITNIKENWVLKVLRLEDFTPHTKGIYRHIRHPNYLVVIFEIIIVPVLLNLATIGVIFFGLNLILLLFRIHYEELELEKFEEYAQYKKNTYRLIPFIY